jgi:hypothetical protein
MARELLARFRSKLEAWLSEHEKRLADRKRRPHLCDQTEAMHEMKRRKRRRPPSDSE